MIIFSTHPYYKPALLLLLTWASLDMLAIPSKGQTSHLKKPVVWAGDDSSLEPLARPNPQSPGPGDQDNEGKWDSSHPLPFIFLLGDKIIKTSPEEALCFQPLGENKPRQAGVWGGNSEEHSFLFLKPSWGS